MRRAASKSENWAVIAAAALLVLVVVLFGRQALRPQGLGGGGRPFGGRILLPTESGLINHTVADGSESTMIRA